MALCVAWDRWEKRGKHLLAGVGWFIQWGLGVPHSGVLCSAVVDEMPQERGNAACLNAWCDCQPSCCTSLLWIINSWSTIVRDLLFPLPLGAVCALSAWGFIAKRDKLTWYLRRWEGRELEMSSAVFWGALFCFCCYCMVSIMPGQWKFAPLCQEDKSFLGDVVQRPFIPKAHGIFPLILTHLRLSLRMKEQPICYQTRLEYTCKYPVQNWRSLCGKD